MRRSARVGRWLVTGNAGWLTALAALGLVAGILLVYPGLRRDYRLDAFVSSDDEAYAQLQGFLAQFPSSEYALVAVHGPTAFSADLERAAGELAAVLRSVPGVQECRSYGDLPGWLRTTLGERLRSHPLIAGNLISADGRTYAVLCAMAGESERAPSRRATVHRLREVVAQAEPTHPDLRYVLTGPYVTLVDMYSYVDRDLLIFSILAFVLSTISLALVFGRWAPMVYAGGAATAAILLTLGLAAALGVVTSLITQMLVILIIVLTLANAVHLAIAAEETHVAHPRQAHSPAAYWTLRRMLAPCTAAMVTTAVAFGSVGISTIAPVRRFGLLMCFGMLIGLVAGLVGAVPLHRRSCPPRGFVGVTGALDGLARIVLRRPGAVALTFLLAIGGVVAGVTRLRSESDFVQNFRPDSSVRQGYAFLEEHLTPLGAVEVLVRRKDARPIVSTETIHQAADLGEAAVADYPMVRRALSLNDVLTLIAPGRPRTDAELFLRRTAMEATPAGRQLLRGFLNEAGDTLRVHLRCEEGYPVEEKLAACSALERDARRRFGPQFEVQVTGLYAFYAKLVAGLIRDQYRALALTVGAIFVALWLSLGSLRLAALALLVNLLPVGACLGAMGWLRTPVTMTTAMVLAVTLGIAVDSTVHYLIRLKTERKTRRFREAVRAAHRSTGRACVFTTVVIACGFSVLMLSPFLPTAHFGGLVGLTMFVALGSGLVLLPALLVMLERRSAG